ncbi:MAG: GTPase HflX [Candidatus Marinamargulisbacteria bacterium]
MTRRGICVGVHTPTSDWPAEDSLAELAELATTAGLTIQHSLAQTRPRPNQLSYVGKGKLQEIAHYIQNNAIEVAIFDDELSPMQQRHIENELKVKILDRTSLVLDIFSQRAQTKEAQIQIELAQLQYLQPRLRRMWTHLSRLGGGIGTRGPGETQLEVDRRQIDRRIQKLRNDLEKVRLTRENQRKQRVFTPHLTVAIMGYTNAGKSTLHHLLTDSGVRQENQLFATLDPTTRQLKLPSNDTVLITDTVGFIRKLPHQLVNAFKATLEEVIYADLILHVIDCSNHQWRDLMKTSHDVLQQLDIQLKNELIIFNKIDCAKDPVLTKHDCGEISTLFINAKQKDTRDVLIREIENNLHQFRTTMTFTIPFNKMSIYNILHKKSAILSTQNTQDGIIITCKINRILGSKIMSDLHSFVD